jgi:uncharacterized membrane protein
MSNAGDLPPEIIERVKREVIVAIQHDIYSGSLPPPELLQMYEQMNPGTAKVLLEDFLNNSAALRDMEKQNLKMIADKDKRAQYFAFACVVLSLLTTIVLALTGHDWLGGVVVGTSVIALVATFLGQKLPQKLPSPKEPTT